VFLTSGPLFRKNGMPFP